MNPAGIVCTNNRILLFRGLSFIAQKLFILQYLLFITDYFLLYIYNETFPSA